MKRWSALLLALVMVLILAACGSNGDTPSVPAASTPEATAAAAEPTAPEAPSPATSAPATPAPDAAAPDAAEPAGTETPASEPPREGAIDQFIFRTSDETRAFLQDYDPSGTLEFDDPYWREYGSDFILEGKLTPDKSAFSYLEAEPNTSDVSEAKELLQDFYLEVCEKTGLEFPGAEDGIQRLETLDDNTYFTADGIWFGLYPARRGMAGGGSLKRVHSEVGAVPYSPDDAYAYLQNHGGRAPSLTRSVSGTTEMDWSWTQRCPYGWSAELNQNDCLAEVEASYFAEDPEAAKAYFTAFTEFYLTGGVLEEALNFLSENFDALEQGSNETIRIADYYSLYLSRYSSYMLRISLRSDEIPSTAQPFMNAEEQALMQLDPITRLGISKDVQMPETVLYERGEMKVVLDRVFYTESQLCIQLRFENVPELVRVSVNLRKINGQPYDRFGDPSMWTLSSVELSAGRVKDPVVEEIIYVGLDTLLASYDYTGLLSLSFDGVYDERSEENDYDYTRMTDLDEVTVMASN